MTAPGVDAYLADVPEPQRSTLETVRQRLRQCLPDADEVISYGVPTFKAGGVGVAGYASARNHCSYLPMSGSVLVQLETSLAAYDWSKGTLRFPVDEPLPANLIAALVDARLAEIAKKRR
jgi:uncharacterized protein YdhG (YjbR/CyaY superfamily)